MAIEPLSWTTTADAGAVLTTVGTALQSLGYTVTPNADGWSGTADVGSKVGRAIGGGEVSNCNTEACPAARVATR